MGDVLDGTHTEPSEIHGQPIDDSGATELTLPEVAGELGVHYMTAYRYIRIGRLIAHKDGREWKVRRRDLDLLVSNSAAGQSSPPKRADWHDRLFNRVTAFDDQGAWVTLEAALTAGLDPLDAYNDVIIPVLHRLGKEWRAGAISIAEEHAATNVCQRIVGRLGLRTSRRGVSKGTVVLGCPANEEHRLATSIAADIFRLGGYEVVDCGVDLPPDSFATLVRNTPRLVAVGISSTATNNEAATAELIEATRDHNPNATIILGGGAACSIEPAKALGSDFVSTTASEGLARLAQFRSERRS